MSDGSSTTSDGARSDTSQERVPVRGGAGGVAALIRATQQQGGGLADLRKVPVPRDVRLERCQSSTEGSTSSGVANPVPKPSRVGRLHSVPDDLVLSNQSNGDIPSSHKTPLLPPSSARSRDDVPPKPPRTGSTSPSAFLSLDRGRELEVLVDEEGEDEMYEQELEECLQSSDELLGEYQVDQAESPSTKRPSSSTTAELTFDPAPTSSSPATVRLGSGKPPKVPMLPPVNPTSKTPPTPNRTTPTTTRQSPKQKPPPYAKTGSESPGMERPPRSSKTPPTPQRTTPTSSAQHSPKFPLPVKTLTANSATEKSHSDTSHSEESHSNTGSSGKSHSNTNEKSKSGSGDANLKSENEMLKEQIRLLQQRLQHSQPSASNQTPTGDTCSQRDKEPDIPDPLTSPEEPSGRLRSRSVSPGGDEERDKFPSGDPRPAPKPVPLPRTRVQTVSIATSQKKGPAVLSPSSLPPTVGFAPPKDPPTSAKVVGVAVKPKVPILPPGSGSPVPKPRSKVPDKTSVSNHVDSGQNVEVKSVDKIDSKTASSVRKGSLGDTSADSAERVKAVITLQKLLPSSSKIKTPLLPLVKPVSPGLEEESNIVSKVSSPCAVQSPTSRAIPVPKPVLATTSAQSLVPRAKTDETKNSAFSKSIDTSLKQKSDRDDEVRNSDISSSVEVKSEVVRSPLSSSVPPPSLLSQSDAAPRPTSAHVKAPLQSSAMPVPSSAGKAKYKKVTLQDTSWIKRKDNSTSGSKPSTPVTKSVAKPSSATTSVIVSAPSQSGLSSSATSTTGPARPQPYRSHAIISGPKIVEQPFIPRSASSPEPSQPGKATPLKVPELPSRNRTETVSSGSDGKKRLWGKTPSDGSTKKPQRRHSFTRSTSNEAPAPIQSDSSKGKEKNGSKWGKKTSNHSGMVDASPSKLSPKTGHQANKKLSDSRPISMMVNSENKAGFTASATVSSMPRGLQAEEMYKQHKQKKSFLGRFKSKTTVQKPATVEEVDNSDDSGSDDEKGGTIKKMPKLRHVTVKRPDKEDDSEPEYHQLFEYVFVVSLKEDGKGKITTEMTYTFPPTSREFSGKDVALKSIPQFCFPDIDQWKPTKHYKSESYSFVLTDMEGNRRFGYCRRLLPEGSGARLPEVFCIVSPLGCFSLYENILDHVEERRAVSSLSVFNFLKAISANPFPRPGRSVEVKVFGARGSGMETLTFNRPMDSRLEHVDFSLLFATLSHRKIIQLFSSLLMERRVIFCAKSLSLMTGCAHALMALLYPFEWQHVFIPVLPSSLIDFVCSPLPYIIGINPASCQRLDDMETMEEALVVHLDKGKFLKRIGDETSILPSKLFQFLEGKLSSSTITSEYSKKSPSRKGAGPSKADEILVNTFMTFFAYLYGDYSDQMKVSRSGQREFQRANHIKKFSSKSTRRFLEAFHMTQMFENFIEQRENPSKTATVAESLFEKKLPELKERCQDIEIFSSKSRFDRWKMKKDLAKGD